MNVVVSAIVDPWVTTFSFVVALAMRIQDPKATVSIGYNNGTTYTPVSEREKVQLDLNIPPKSE